MNSLLCEVLAIGIQGKLTRVEQSKVNLSISIPPLYC